MPINWNDLPEVVVKTGVGDAGNLVTMTLKVPNGEIWQILGAELLNNTKHLPEFGDAWTRDENSDERSITFMFGYLRSGRIIWSGIRYARYDVVGRILSKTTSDALMFKLQILRGVIT